ncbi:MAG TPA: aminotransferase class V-fold PLP-dependent enzyme [Bryobacteraceae bacterium]|jgi:selenocysteine lyase/cysteine desulfurase|nr:aminotransferase class V-fold PLP-dependent enzyme [Bryobacteraceae bacterium]
MSAPAPAAETRGEYLFAEGLTYLNTGTLGPCRRATVDETLKRWEHLELNPVSFYGKLGSEPLAERTRAVAAKFLGCDTGEIVITNSTTSGMNAVAQGFRLKPGDRILTTNHEHGGGLLGWKYFEKYNGAVVDTVSFAPEEHDTDAILAKIRAGIRKETRVITVSHVFSSTGLRMPIAEISAIARAQGVLCVVDGAQSAGAIRVNVRELGCHAYATSGHKWLMGPKGTGLLYIAKEAQSIVRPMQFEESYNTYNDGNGVVNLAAILGLAEAIEHLDSLGIDKVEEHNLAIRNQLYDRLAKSKRLKVVSPAAGPVASPMVAAILPEGIDKRVFVQMLLDKHRLSIRPTHDEFGFNGIRFSMHIFNTANDVDFAASVVQKEL